MYMSKKYASYIRVSTNKQEGGEKSQRDEIRSYLEQELEVDYSEVDEYADIGKSGNSGEEEREQLKELINNIDNYEVVVLSELSRLARKTSLGAQIVEKAIEGDTILKMTSGICDEVHPDKEQSKLMADLIMSIQNYNLKQIQKRIQRGVDKAQKQGKWHGQPPAGFKTDENGYLQVDHEEYPQIKKGIEMVEEGESYRSVAQNLNITRPTLMSLHKNKKSWYLDSEKPDDERVQEALDSSNM